MINDFLILPLFRLHSLVIKEIYIKPLPINIWVLRRNHFCKTYNQELKDIYNELVEYNENYLDKLEFKDFVSFIYNNFYNQ